MRIHHRALDGGVWVFIWIFYIKPAGGVVARIHHRANHIHIFRDLHEILADSLRSGNRSRIAENINGYSDAKRSKLCFGIFDKIGNNLDTRSVAHRVFQRIRTFLEALREAYIVKLNFFEA
ncbi:hypothetical protein D3C75_1026500 [compost metagenome]